MSKCWSWSCVPGTPVRPIDVASLEALYRDTGEEVVAVPGLILGLRRHMWEVPVPG